MAVLKRHFGKPKLVSSLIKFGCMKKIQLILFGSLLIGYCQAQVTHFVSDSLDSYIEKGMKKWQIPGLAITIVKDGKIVAMKGYGERNIWLRMKK